MYEEILDGCSSGKLYGESLSLALGRLGQRARNLATAATVNGFGVRGSDAA
jgi:hypothetical protein